MADSNISVTIDAMDRLSAQLRRVARVDVPHLMLALDVAVQPDPEIVVAGIEGRATVRAGMRDVLRWLGEVK